MIDPAVLQGFFNAQTTLALSSRRAGANALASTSSLSSGVVPPWDPKAPQPRETERLIAALRTEKFVDFDDAGFDRDGVPEDHKKLFGLYKALNTLSIIANEAADKDTSATRLAGYDRRFQIGLAQFTDALASTSFDALTLMTGKKSDYMESPLAVPRDRSQFATRALRIGDPEIALEGITGTESFTIRVRKNNVDTDVLIDLSTLSGAANISNIAKLMNDSLAAAGMVTRVTRAEVGVAESGAPRKWGLKIEGVSTEQLNFIPAAANPAIYAVAAIGSGDSAGARIAKLADNGGASPEIISTASVAAEGGAFTPVTAKTDSDGNVFVLGTTAGSSGTQVLQGEKDMMLRKLDSAGNVLWTKLLGTSDRAEAAALAVDADGNVILAGRINGKLDPAASASANGNWDSIVAKFDSDGEEVFARQTAPLANDEATSLAVATDGAIYVGGVTSGRLAGVATHGGGTDAFITRLSAEGALVWNRQLGGTGNERVARLSIADDGELLVATTEDGTARLAKYDVSTAASAATWDLSLGSLSGGAISALTARDGKVYVAGYTSNTSFDAGGLAATNAHNGGVDGFVMTLTDDGSSVTPVDTNYIGSDNTDRIRDIAVTDSAIYVTGETDDHLPGQTTAPEGGKSAFVTKIPLDASSSFTHYFGGPGGTGAGAAIVVDETGSSVLDALGLPRGELDYTPARTLTARTTARPGDWFTVSVDGARERRITIREGETVRSLVNKINRVLLLDGKASVKRGAEGDQLRITAREGSIIDIKAGADGLDALKGLGLQPGKIVAAAKLSSAGLDDEDEEVTEAEADEEEKQTDNIFGLGLKAGLSLLSRENAAAANDAIRDAMSIIRKAYREITRDPALDALLERRSGGTVPAYMRAQLGNYQAGLARLQSGGGSTGGLF